MLRNMMMRNTLESDKDNAQKSQNLWTTYVLCYWLDKVRFHEISRCIICGNCLKLCCFEND